MSPTIPVIPVSSPELYATYIAWRDQDVEGHSPEAHWKRIYGLCDWVGLVSDAENAQFELGTQLGFWDAEDIDYPFGGQSEYMRRASTGTQHLNEARVKWVNDRITDYENSLKGETP